MGKYDGVELPEWNDQPVPDYDLDPIHDAIGKFIRACKAMEIFLTIFYSHCEDMSYEAASRKPITDHIKRLTKLAHRVADEHREEYDRAMRDATSIVAIRNGVVHGVGWSYGDRARTERPDRAFKPDVPHDWLTVDYDRELLIGAGRRARQIAGFIQVHCMR